MNKIRNLEEQYDKIYRYCYFKLRHRETAEDITQETFLRFFRNPEYRNTGKALRYLYTIARNLCIDEYRKSPVMPLPESLPEDSFTEDVLTRLSLRNALNHLEEPERELLLLRYVNEMPLSELCGFYGISRFSLYRRLNKATGKLKENLRKEDYDE